MSLAISSSLAVRPSLSTGQSLGRGLAAGSSTQDEMPNPPPGTAYVKDNFGNLILWKRTVYSEPTYLLKKVN